MNIVDISMSVFVVQCCNTEFYIRAYMLSLSLTKYHYSNKGIRNHDLKPFPNDPC